MYPHAWKIQGAPSRFAKIVTAWKKHEKAMKNKWKPREKAVKKTQNILYYCT